MELVNLYERKTHYYSDGWSGEDDWTFRGSLKLTPPKQVREGNNYDDLGTFVRYTRIPSGTDWRQVAQTVRDTMCGSRCRHEYDCCGCTSHAVSAKLVAPRKLLIRTTVTRNY